MPFGAFHIHNGGEVMATLAQLKRRLEEEKNKLRARQEMSRIGRERSQIKKEIRITKFKRRFSTTVSAFRGAKSLGIGATRASKRISKSVRTFDRNLAARQRKSKSRAKDTFGFDIGF